MTKLRPPLTPAQYEALAALERAGLRGCTPGELALTLRTSRNGAGTVAGSLVRRELARKQTVMGRRIYVAITAGDPGDVLPEVWGRP